MEVSQAITAFTTAIEVKNAKLKKLLAETLLDKTALEDVVQKSGEAGAASRCRELFAIALFNEPTSSLPASALES